ncbi:methyl-accepting chemotaxis protein [Chamaesiphon sp. OTE_20_metabat_361]|uniref:methyl-accepting chemotaxis protein n=1 Tax=Chamaesiphon sp. OTE_20_metabat_361 TaxID=2964689 RepID=UPI00286ACDCA|nr:methyl-accepting chemotaxis protein [Chamaesiphon sp. OTE_20_metabat_361]
MQTNLWNRVNTLSFKTKSTLIAIALGILPIATIGTTTYLQVSTASQQQAAKKEKERAELIADKFNRFMFERNGDVSVIAALPIFNSAKVIAISSTAEKTNLLDRFIDTYQVYDSIAVFDIKGNLVAQSKGESLTKINHSNRQYFKDALKAGKAVVSAPEASKYTGRISVFFAAPIRDSITNNIIGVVRTRTPVERLGAVLEDFANKQERYHIIDRQNNKVFISSNGEYTDRPESPAMLAARTKGGLILRQQTGSNRSEFLSAAPFKKLEGMTELPWTAVATIDEDAAYIELQGLLWTTLLGAMTTGALTVGLAIFFADRTARYVQRTIATITNSANEIVDSVESQEISINQQANSAIATTDSVNELENISTATAAQATASATGAKQALSLAEEGSKAVQKTIHEISELRDRVDEIAQQIVNLGEQTGQITNVSDSVSDLAKQTNMLALKAAVEAARAGEQGKGFGVVAGEIRKLADESKKSAQKINDLATDIQAAIARTVTVTDRGTRTATEGIQIAENTASTFIGVTDAVNNVFLNSQQISASTQRQSTAIQQVLGAMNAISQGSQESAIGMHKVKTSTRELNQIADELQAVVS